LKPAYYLLTAVLLLVVALIATILIWTGQKPRVVAAPVRREVYVDLQALVRSHPAYRGLEAMSQSSRSQSYSASACRLLPALQLSKTDGLLDSRGRQQVEAAIAREAVAELNNLEAVRIESLQARLRTMRENLNESSAAQVQAIERQIAAERTAALRAALCCTALERINILARIAAYQTQAKTPIANQSAVKAAIAREKDQLAMLEARRSKERRRVEDDYSRRIQQQAQEIAATVAEELATTEEQGRQRIAEDVSHARAALLSGLSERLGSAEYVAAEGRPAVAELVVCPGIPGFAAPSGALTRSGSASMIRAKLMARLARSVQAIADREGLRVSFARRPGLPDETNRIRRLLQQRAWGTVGA
jgi:hypothetical protein